MNKGLLFFYAFMALLLGCIPLVGQQGTQTTLIADQVQCIVGQQYAILMTDYSDKVYDYLQNNRRIVIDFNIADKTIAENGGTWFRPLKEGETDITLCIYGEQKGNMGAPDWDNLLDEVTFHMTAQTEVALTLPKLYTEWGKKRNVVQATLTKDGAYKDMRENYLKMTPTLPADLMKSVDVYSTGLFETPLLLTYYNERDQLYAQALVVTNFNRVIPADRSPIRAYLESLGFVQTGVDAMGCFQMWHEQSKAQITCEFMSLQGQYVMAVTLMSQEYTPTGMDQIQTQGVSLHAYYEGSRLHIETTHSLGEALSIYTLRGELLSSSTLSDPHYSLELPVAIPVIIRLGDHTTLKVQP